MKKTANLKRGRKHGSYDVIPACVRMRKGPSLELWNSTINILRVLLLTQNIKFTASWVRRVYSEVVLPVLHMLSILLLRSKTAPVSQLLGSFVFTTMSSTWSKSAKAQQKLFICFIFFYFFFVPVSVTALRSEIVRPIEIPLTTFCFGRIFPTLCLWLRCGQQITGGTLPFCSTLWAILAVTHRNLWNWYRSGLFSALPWMETWRIQGPAAVPFMSFFFSTRKRIHWISDTDKTKSLFKHPF